jgi:hypothetical protein
MNPIIIKGDKTKLRLALYGSLLFVGFGFFFLIAPAILSRVSDEFAIVLIAVGLLCIVLFGFATSFFLKKLKDNSPAFIISEDGITDNSSAISMGFIPWVDIAGIGEVSAVGQRFVTVKLNDAQVYIDKISNGLKRKMVSLNYKLYGSAVCITVNGLQCNHQQLKTWLEKGLGVYKEHLK